MIDLNPFQLFEEAVSSISSILLPQGYTLTFEKDESNLKPFARYITAKYFNKLKNITVEILFQPYNGGGYLMTDIGSENGKIFFYIYLKVIKEDSNATKINSLKNIEGESISEKLKRYFDLLGKELKTGLSAVISGRAWIKINYDPRDDY